MTEDSLGKALMLKSTERMTEFLGMMDRFEQLTWDEVENIVTVGVWSPGTRHKLFEELRLHQEMGSARPADVPSLKYHLRAEVADSFHMADKAGVTGIGSMVFERDDGLPPWRIYNPSILVANYDEGGYGVISGKPRKGKTSLACSMIEEWIRSKERVAFSNILPVGKKGLYTYTPGIKALFQGIAALREGIQWLFILDEGSFVYSRPDQVTRRVKDLDKLMRIIGKMFGNMVLVEHIPEAVPAVVQQFATSYYYCHEPGIVSINLKGPSLEYHTKVHSFPLSGIPFETRDWAFFKTSGVDLQRLLDHVSGSKDRRAAMGEFLEKEEKPPLPKKVGRHPTGCRCDNCLEKEALKASP